MPRINSKIILDHAAEFSYAVPAFNVNCFDQCIGIVESAAKVDSPAILQLTSITRRYFNDIIFNKIIEGLVDLYPKIPICVHLDHAFTVNECQSAFINGYTSVMMDGSLCEDGSTISNLDYNVDITRKVVNIAHRHGFSVEGALGIVGSIHECIGRVEDNYKPSGLLCREQFITNPNEAQLFVNATGVDSLSIAIGSTHGAFKFSDKPTPETLNLDIISQIHKLLPNTHLVLHGASSVPHSLQEIFNESGGEMPKAWGVSIDIIKQGIKLGIRKINIDTDNRLAMTGQIRKSLMNKTIKDPKSYLMDGREAVKKLCCERFEEFGSAGQASKIISTIKQ